MTLTKNECGYWEVRVKGKDGKIKSFSTKQKDKREAKRVIAEAKIAELERASEIGVLTRNVIMAITCGTRMDTDKAALEWIRAMHRRGYAASTTQNAMIWITAFFNARNLHKRSVLDITEDDVDQWINKDDPTVKASTRKIMLSQVRSFCDFCVDKGWMMANPAGFAAVDLSKLLHTQKEVEHRQAFMDAEIDELLAALDPETGTSSYRSPFWFAAVAISRYTGLRLGDIACLEWASFSTPGKIAVWTQKRDKRVELDLTPDVLRRAVSLIPRVDDTFCFPDKRQDMKGSRRGRASIDFADILASLCIFGKSFHCLRHTYIQDCYLRGIPIPHIAVNVGHSNEETTKGYLGGLEERVTDQPEP